jgi:hypothetical protein
VKSSPTRGSSFWEKGQALPLSGSRKGLFHCLERLELPFSPRNRVLVMVLMAAGDSGMPQRDPRAIVNAMPSEAKDQLRSRIIVIARERLLQLSSSP